MRVLLIDDHALFRIGLRELLERRGIEVVDAIGDCDIGIEQVEKLLPDIVLLDMRMPQMSGIEVLRKLRDRQLKMAISMLTTSREEKDVIESLQYGAQGYLLKDMEPDELITALNDILDGNRTIGRHGNAPELTSVLARAVQGEAREAEHLEDRFADLTPRESEILCHLAAGQSNKVIANHLGITDGTVKLHVKAILRKLNVQSRVEAAVIAVEQNLCSRNETN